MKNKQQKEESARSVERIGKALDLTKGSGGWGWDRWFPGSPDWH